MARLPRPIDIRRNEGFTLLEMVVSLSILAAIMAFLVVAFRLAGQSLARGGEEAMGMARLRAGTELLERAIRSAEPMEILRSEGALVPYFRGESKKLRFLSAAPPASLSGGAYRLLCFFAGSTQDADGLFLSGASPLRAEGVEGWEGTEKPRVLFPDAAEVAFFYSTGPNEDGKYEWEREWDSREKKALPAAVRVEFLTPSEGGPLRTALVVPVPAGGKSDAGI
jgi:general secretion pathway protein J